MKALLWLSVAAAMIFAVLVLPNQPDLMTWSVVKSWPLELPVLLLAMVAIGRRFAVTYALSALLLVVFTLKVADYTMHIVFNRGFDPLLDGFLIGAGLTLLRGNVGIALTVVAVIAVGILIGALFLLVERCLRIWADVNPTPAIRIGAGVAALACGVWAGADVGHHLKYWSTPSDPPGSASTARLTLHHTMDMRATAADLAHFNQKAENDVYADATGLLDQLEGRDVILIWIESYGRASFDNPLYAPTHLATLHAAEAEIADTGMAMKSGWLTSPTAAGQSWLAHGSLASGLWTSNNGRYKAMLNSGQKWLFHFAQDAGYRTVAVMPAITKAWPESLVMGFDLVLPAAQIPYKGDRFRWVTMPDQFTLAAYSSLMPPDPRPNFVQIALISSHAPWTPIADMVPWENVGDGTIFNEMAARGPAPKELWRDRDLVRDAYRRAVDYTLRVTFSHVARLGQAAPLVIVAGDHQSAAFVAGSKSKDVAVHMIAPPHVLDLITHWNWSDGLVPASDAPVRGMDSFRNDFLAAFTKTQISEMKQP